jgi:hypothetical protein
MENNEIKTANDGLIVNVLTYCHACGCTVTGQSEKCSKCGSDELLLFVAGPSIESWIVNEKNAEKAYQENCGCLDHIDW